MIQAIGVIFLNLDELADLNYLEGYNKQIKGNKLNNNKTK